MIHTVMMQQNSDIKEKLFLLVEKHCQTLMAEAQAIDLLMQSAQSNYDLDTLQKLFFLTHKLKGSSATMGFQQVSQHAEQLEAHLKGLLEAQHPPLSDQSLPIITLNDALQKAITAINPDKSTLLDRFR